MASAHARCSAAGGEWRERRRRRWLPPLSDKRWCRTTNTRSPCLSASKLRQGPAANTRRAGARTQSPGSGGAVRACGCPLLNHRAAETSDNCRPAAADARLASPRVTAQLQSFGANRVTARRSVEVDRMQQGAQGGRHRPQRQQAAPVASGGVRRHRLRLSSQHRLAAASPDAVKGRWLFGQSGCWLGRPGWCMRGCNSLCQAEPAPDAQAPARLAL